jgi:hypothetical protein
MKTMLITAMALMGFASCFADECTDLEAIRKPFVDKLVEVAGPDARNCGLVRRGAKTAPAVQCARQMLQQKRPFYVGVQLQGVDSILWSGIAADKSGTVSQLYFDSDVRGSICKYPKLTVTTCASVVLPKGADRTLHCAQK